MASRIIFGLIDIFTFNSGASFLKGLLSSVGLKFLDIYDESIDANPNNYRQYLKGHTALTDNLISKAPIGNFRTCDEITSADKDSINKFYALFTKYKVIYGTINLSDLLYCK